MSYHQLGETFIEIIEAVDGTWMILVDGIQWAPVGEPRDRSGAGCATYPDSEAALAAFGRAEREADGMWLRGN
jgi:hypothetical protein